jgi:hypothetical protein
MPFDREQDNAAPSDTTFCARIRSRVGVTYRRSLADERGSAPVMRAPGESRLRATRVARTLLAALAAGAMVGLVQAVLDWGAVALYALSATALLVVGFFGFRGPIPERTPWEERGRSGGLFSDL